MAAIRLEDLPCAIRGEGKSRKCVLIPTIKECGVTCVPINSSDSWLSQLLGDRARGDGALIVKEFVEDLRDAIRRETGAAPLTEERSSEAKANDSTGEPVGRQAMGLDDDSEEEALAEKPVPKAWSHPAKTRGIKETWSSAPVYSGTWS